MDVLFQTNQMEIIMRQLIIALGSIALLAGCSSGPKDFTPKTTVRVVNTTVYPELPDVPAVPDPGLIPWSYDFPRDTTKVTVKNTTKCTSVPESSRDDAFWGECGENPIISDTNIFIGLSRENWDTLNSNLKKLQENIYLYKTRINQINEQRREWRRKTEEERQKSKDTETTTTSASEENTKKTDVPARPSRDPALDNTEKPASSGGSFFGFRWGN